MTQAEFEAKYVNQIICSDCISVMKDWPDKCVDLVLTSPPYNFDAGSGLGCKYDYDFMQKGYKDNLSTETYYQQQRTIIESLLRVNKNEVFYNIQMIAGNKDALFQLIGFFNVFLKEIIIWNKITAEPAINENCLNSQFEFILVFSKNNKRKFDRCFFGRGELSNVWGIGKNVQNRFNIETGHYAVMPFGLAKKVLLNFSQQNDIILDPMCGIGTSCIAAKLLGRRYIGIDISETYCIIARERLEAVDTGVSVQEQRKGQIPLFPIDNAK